jgi:DnaK suppressor protein
MSRQIKTITEAQLLSSPASDYMNREQLDFFKQKLLQMQQELTSKAQETGTYVREASVVADPFDRASQEEERAFELRTRERETQLLKKIQFALQRIDEGSYGFCEETGEPIGLARLLARPIATLSLEAQERREKLDRVHSK